MAKKNSAEASCVGPYEKIARPMSNENNIVAVGFFEGKIVSFFCQHYDEGDKTCTNVNIHGAGEEGFEYQTCLVYEKLKKAKKSK